MRLPIATCVLALTSATWAHAEVRGRVIATDGAPVVSAIVTAAKFAATTDAHGAFVLPVDPPVTLTVRADAFTPHEQLVETDEPLVVTLQPAALSEEITVTATRTRGRTGTASSTIVLDREELSSSAAPTLDDALRTVPGFTLFRRSGSRTANPTSQGVSLRGVGASGASRAIVLDDGIPMNDPFGGWIYWGRVPLAAVDRVEIVRGGTSDLYGSSGLGGAIQLIRRRGQGIGIDLSTGSHGTTLASAYASFAAGGVGITLDGESFGTDGFTPIAPSLRGAVDRPANVERTGADLTIDFTPRETTRFFLRGTRFDESRNNGTVLQENETSLSNLVAGVDQHFVSGLFSVRLYRGSQDYAQSFTAVEESRATERLTRLQKVPSEVAGMTAFWSGALGTQNLLAVGAELREVQGRSNEQIFAGPNVSEVSAGGTQRIISFFAEDALTLGARTTLTASLRYDRWANVDAFRITRDDEVGFEDRDDDALTPRLTLRHQLGRGWQLTTSAYEAFRAPTLNELYRSFRVGNVVTEANESLRSETVTGFEGGARFASADGGTRLHALFFHMTVDDPIANVTIATTPSLVTRRRENLGETRSRGVEIDAELRLGDSISAGAGYLFTDSTVESFAANPEIEGNQLPQVPRHQATARLRLRGSLLAPETRLLRDSLLALELRYGGSQFDDDRNELELDDFVTLDLLASLPLNERISLIAAVENATDEVIEAGRTPLLTLGQPRAWRLGARFTR